jgi:ABC-type lipoprotein export system ATPase subunit
VAIARALVTNPSIILADEPTGNLDSQASREIMDTLTQLNREGITIILDTHEADIAAYAGRGITMKDGMILSDRAAGGAAVTRVVPQEARA